MGDHRATVAVVERFEHVSYCAPAQRSDADSQLPDCAASESYAEEPQLVHPTPGPALD